MYEDEFDWQIGNLLSKGYPHLAGMNPEEFTRCFQPLKRRLGELVAPGRKPEEGYIPFVIVVTSGRIAAEETMPLVEREGKKGMVSLFPGPLENFTPLDSVGIPNAMTYLLVDIDRGKETLNFTPKAALQRINEEKRSPLTIEEGIALLTHYPAFLQKNNGFSLLASRCGDRRVPAVWLSGGRPKLGWCWEGNPHTWLGSASCRDRLATA